MFEHVSRGECCRQSRFRRGRFGGMVPRDRGARSGDLQRRKALDAVNNAENSAGLAPTAADIRAQLERVIASAALRPSPRRAGLLRFVVEETLAGRADRLKGFTVATAVFGRDETFDSQSDPIVRLEARRLRHDIDGYYADEGRHDPVRISIPKGAYVPSFAWQDRVGEPPGVPAELVTPPPLPEAPLAVASSGRRRRLLLLATLAAVLLIAAASAAFLRGSRQAAGPVGPAIIVLPFDALGVGEHDHNLASGLTYELIADLMRFAHFRVYSAPASFRQDGGTDAQALGRDLGVAYVVKGALSSDGDHARLAAQLYDAESGRIVWSDTYDRSLTPGALLQVQEELAASIATVLGEPYGQVRADLSKRVSAGTAPSMPSYTCVLRAYDYRRGFDEKLYQPVLGCLKAAVARDPDYAAAWAMLGWLELDAARFHYVPAERTEETLDQAIASASRAVDLDGSSPLGLQALSASLYYAGRYEESMEVQRGALALNDNDPDTLAQLGWRLAARGEFDEGIAYLERAVARSANPPGWYFHLLAVRDYLKGDYQHMLETAERSAVDGSGISWSFIAIARAALGQPEEARAALDRWASIDPEAHADPGAEYRMHGGTDATVNALVAGLRKAGWTDPRSEPTN
jgi:TolB-like protein